MRATDRITRPRRPSARAALVGAGLVLMPLAPAGAADLNPGLIYPDRHAHPIYTICELPTGPVILFDRKGRPTVPARTPMFYCLTGHTLTPGEVPPPPEYCCR